MPIEVFGSSSDNAENKIVTSLFVQKTYLRSSYIASNIEEHIDLKSQFRAKNLLDPICIREAASTNYVDKKFHDHSIIKNRDHVDFDDENLDNIQSIKVNSFPTIEEFITPKMHVHQAISNFVGESLLRLDPDEKIDDQDFIVFSFSLTLPKTKKITY